MADEHLRIKQVFGQPPPDYPQSQSYIQPMPEPKYNWANFIWHFSSWTLIIINIFTASITLRDMFNTTYSALNHWMMTAVFLASIGGLSIIHTYILRRK